MARQNYGYEKRQKELAKQKKQEAKRQRKIEKKLLPQSGEGEQEEASMDAEAVPQEDASAEEQP